MILIRIGLITGVALSLFSSSTVTILYDSIRPPKLESVNSQRAFTVLQIAVNARNPQKRSMCDSDALKSWSDKKWASLSETERLETILVARGSFTQPDVRQVAYLVTCDNSARPTDDHRGHVLVILSDNKPLLVLHVQDVDSSEGYREINGFISAPDVNRNGFDELVFAQIGHAGCCFGVKFHVLEMKPAFGLVGQIQIHGFSDPSVPIRFEVEKAKSPKFSIVILQADANGGNQRERLQLQQSDLRITPLQRTK
jgi:hypothetical protein